jgi:hypothetical protein
MPPPSSRPSCRYRPLTYALLLHHFAVLLTCHCSRVQATWRGARARPALARRSAAAFGIQAIWCVARVRMDLARRYSAATAVQAAWRCTPGLCLFKSLRARHASVPRQVA